MLRLPTCSSKTNSGLKPLPSGRFERGTRRRYGGGQAHDDHGAMDCMGVHRHLERHARRREVIEHLLHRALRGVQAQRLVASPAFRLLLVRDIGMQFVIFKFAAQLVDFFFARLVFRNLALDEAHRDPGFFFQPRRREQVRVLALVGVIAEVLRLDEALFHQRFQAIICFAQTYAHGLRQTPLAHLRPVIQQLEEFEALGIGEYGTGKRCANCGLTVRRVECTVLLHTSSAYRWCIPSKRIRHMPALRASYTIAPEILLRFNELVPASERSRTVQALMESILDQREKQLESIAHEFSTHADFAEARADSVLWDVTSLDGLAEQNP